MVRLKNLTTTLSPGAEVAFAMQIPFEDISITREIHRNRGYRLHSDNSSVKARVVKVYQGPRAKEVSPIVKFIVHDVHL